MIIGQAEAEKSSFKNLAKWQRFFQDGRQTVNFRAKGTFFEELTSSYTTSPCK